MSKSKFSLPLLAIASLLVLSSCTGGPSDNQSTTTITSTTATATNTLPSNTVSKTISYNTPGGMVNANFIIALTSDKTVTGLTVNITSGDHESKGYISRFVSSANSEIVGKKISELSLSAVGGSSLTTDAFKQAIQSL